jgi:hypothetical protein
VPFAAPVRRPISEQSRNRIVSIGFFIEFNVLSTMLSTSTGDNSGGRLTN